MLDCVKWLLPKNPCPLERTEGRIKDESESREEVYEYDWATPEQHHSARADACDYKQPTLWSAAMTLIDGSLRRGTDSYSQLEKCSTYTSDSDSLDQSPSSALQSPRLEQFCELIEESSPMSTNSHATEAGRDLEVSTDCDEPIDSAGNGKRYEMTTTECYDFLGPPGKVRRLILNLPLKDQPHMKDDNNNNPYSCNNRVICILFLFW